MTQWETPARKPTSPETAMTAERTPRACSRMACISEKFRWRTPPSACPDRIQRKGSGESAALTGAAVPKPAWLLLRTAKKSAAK